MEDFNKNVNPEGEISGFDTVDSSDATHDNATPEDGFYTKQKNDIIQDDLGSSEPDFQPEAPYKTEPSEAKEPPKPDFYPNGQYGSYNYSNPNFYKPPRQKRHNEKRQFGAGIVILAVVLAAVIGALSGAFATAVLGKEDNVVIKPSEDSGSNININVDKTVESVVEAVADKVTPSVVGIRTTTSVMSFFGGSSEATGEGSGVVYTSDGYIITNYHVIQDAVTNKSGSKIEVFLDSAVADSHTATVVGYNISADLAVIKINVSGLKAAEITDSSNLKVGQYVITVGNPGGLEFMDSVTYGVISGLNRVVSADSGLELIQTDAAINPGNSGGALVNTKGELVGINSSKIVSEEFEGMGFAIPSNTVVEICDNIISKENSPEPYIGITISERYTADVLKYYGYPEGAVVLSVAEGSPAHTAGIRRGDIITEYNGTKITEYQVLENLMEQSTPDESVTVKLYRSGRNYSTTLKVGSNNQVG